MRTKTSSILTTVAAVSLSFVGLVLAQPPNPPNPPAPPAPPAPPDRHNHHDMRPKEPVMFLGVESSPVPPVVSEQLGLPKGFGLVVDYVVPDSPAAGAGVQQSDIIKMLNDQILMEPSQLRKLLQSFPDGTNVTLTILRKGQEQKITVKLVKKEMPKRHAFMPGHDGNWDFDFDGFNGANFGQVDLGDLKERLQDMKERLKEQAAARRDMIRETVTKAHEEAARAREEAHRAAGDFTISRRDRSGLQTTKIDIGKAQIVFSDDKGELRIETLDGKRILTAKDPKGLLLFSGPVETPEDLAKLPADVRERFETLKERDLPSVGSSGAPEDEIDEEDYNGNDDEEDMAPSADQVYVPPQVLPRNLVTFRTILI